MTEQTNIYGGAIPGRPDAIPLHMPSYAMMWKLGGGVSTAEGWGTKDVPSRLQRLMPRNPLTKTTREKFIEPENFNQEVYNDLNLGNIVAYMRPSWGGTGMISSRGRVKGEYRKYNPNKPLYDDEYRGAASLNEAAVDTMYIQSDITSEDFSETAFHEPIHYKQMISHLMGEEYAGFGQEGFNRQARMMEYTTKLAFEDIGMDSDNLWAQIREGKDITHLIPKDFFEEKDGVTWEQRIANKAEKRLEEVEKIDYSSFTISEDEDKMRQYLREKRALEEIITRHGARPEKGREDKIITGMTGHVDLFKEDIG